MADLQIENSSNLIFASWNDETKELIVKFHNGTSYKYPNVSEDLWNEFSKTVNENGSAGKFFNANIKHLPCEKIEE